MLEAESENRSANVGRNGATADHDISETEDRRGEQEDDPPLHRASFAAAHRRGAPRRPLDGDRRSLSLVAPFIDKAGGAPLHAHMRYVYVNDEDMRYLGSLETELSEGDTVSLLPAVAGG